MWKKQFKLNAYKISQSQQRNVCNHMKVLLHKAINIQSQTCCFKSTKEWTIEEDKGTKSRERCSRVVIHSYIATFLCSPNTVIW